MLEELRIRGLGVIEDAVLPLGPGLTVVTGETGAGKTMVVTGLLLLFGGRADSARVRTGSDLASIDGRLHVDDPSTIERVIDAGGALDDGTELVLRRTVSSAGRSRAYVGGAAAPIAVLADLADRLVTVHGQSDQLRLTHRGEQVATLDRYADIDTARYAESYRRWRAAEDALRERIGRAAELRREADMLTHGLAEIEAANPQPGEDTALVELAGRLAHADALTAAARTAHDALAGDQEDPASDAVEVTELLATARRALGQVAGADPRLDDLTARIDEIAALVGELATDLRTYGDEVDADPERLENVQARRSVLASLSRKYADDGAGVESVLTWAARARDRLGDLDVSDEAIAARTAERDAAAAELVTEAGGLSERRIAAAAELGAAVTAELAGLAMAAATAQIEVRPRTASGSTARVPAGTSALVVGADGADDVEFLLQAHPQSPAVPIARGASGGELSRVMLALEVCLAGTDPVPTMVFDEVDAGVGGRAAIEVGRRLAALARDHQVLVVTHLAQVAAYADRHLVVDKPLAAAADRVTSSDVRLVNGDARVAELARMLAGSDTATARKHAAELLAEAANRVKTAS
ncbi:MAG: repair protein RecN [Pseudonocardiales bacterium]|nr:repair protein RecN [Pseudonocardiales bacterium]